MPIGRPLSEIEKPDMSDLNKEQKGCGSSCLHEVMDSGFKLDSNLGFKSKMSPALEKLAEKNDLKIVDKDGKEIAAVSHGQSTVDGVTSPRPTELVVDKDGKVLQINEHARNERTGELNPKEKSDKVQPGGERVKDLYPNEKSGKMQNGGEHAKDVYPNEKSGKMQNGGEHAIDLYPKEKSGKMQNGGEHIIDLYPKEKAGKIQSGRERAIDLYPNEKPERNQATGEHSNTAPAHENKIGPKDQPLGKDRIPSWADKDPGVRFY